MKAFSKAWAAHISAFNPVKHHKSYLGIFDKHESFFQILWVLKQHATLF